jgi:Putative Flp pilus-assembly TadE/G-like
VLVKRLRDESGAITIVVAFSAVMLFALAALVVDLGLARDTRRQSQNAADASALAAANVLYPSGLCQALNPSGTNTPPCFTDAISAAKDYARTNFGVQAADWSGCSDAEHFWAPAGSTPCISFTDDTLTLNQPTEPTKVRVLAPIRKVETPFGAVAGVDHVDISSAARAALSPALDLKCGLCFLGNVISGNADYTVSGGGTIAINGNVDLGATGNMTVDAPAKVGIAGTFDAKQGYHPGATTVAPFTDPLATLPLPIGNAGLAPKTTPCETNPKKGPAVPGEGPGVYGDAAISGTCNLEPGLYIITGTWSLKNNDVLNNKAGGVTLYFTCGTPNAVHACLSSGEPGGLLDAKNGTTELTARSIDPVAGFAVVYDRHNTASIQLQGNGESWIDGGIYAAAASLDFNGTSCYTINRGPVVATSVIKANGTKSCVNVTNAAGTLVKQPPQSPALDR